MECGNRVPACTDAVGVLQNSKHNIQGDSLWKSDMERHELLHPWAHRAL